MRRDYCRGYRVAMFLFLKTNPGNTALGHPIDQRCINIFGFLEVILLGDHGIK